MAKIIALLITISFLMFTSVAQANKNSVIATKLAVINNYDVLLLPACQVDNVTEICVSTFIMNATTLDKWLNKGNLAKFISRNGLEPQVTNGKTIIPKGIMFAIKTE